MSFAVIGTREMSSEQRDWVRTILANGDTSKVLQTGACAGTDQLAATIWMEMGGMVKCYLPWDTYEMAWRTNVSDAYHGQMKAVVVTGESDLAAAHHTRWSTLSQGAQKLHTRNVSIVHGCKLVVACPGDSHWGGGTAMGIKLARHLKIPVYLKDARIRDESFWQYCGCPEGYSGS